MGQNLQVKQIEFQTKPAFKGIEAKKHYTATRGRSKHSQRHPTILKKDDNVNTIIILNEKI